MDRASNGDVTYAVEIRDSRIGRRFASHPRRSWWRADGLPEPVRNVDTAGGWGGLWGACVPPRCRPM